jgi:hypothetical protein
LDEPAQPLDVPALPQARQPHVSAESSQLDEPALPQLSQPHASAENSQSDEPVLLLPPQPHALAESPQLDDPELSQPSQHHSSALADEAAMANFLQRFEAALVAEDLIVVEEQKGSPEVVNMELGDFGASLESSRLNTARHRVMDKQDAASDDKQDAMEGETPASLWRRLATWIGDTD